MRQLAPLFGVSKSTADRIIDHLGPLLALQPRQRLRKDTNEYHVWRERRRRQSSRRICVRHTNAEYKQWRPLQRFTGRRKIYAATHLAIAGLVSDRSARRATRRKPSTELVLAWQTAC